MNSAYQTPEARWQAVLQRDVAADGLFWYGVKTTEIYCRPNCPARRPKPENVVFFDLSAQALATGFRACRRCKPETVDATAQSIATAKHLLETAMTEPSLKELAKATGLSPFHLQRIFKARTGVSPKQYAIYLRTQRLKMGLKQELSVTRALYAAGHNTPSTVYHATTNQLGMTPSSYRSGGKGLNMYYTLTLTSFGPMLLAATQRGLCAVRFGSLDDPNALLAELKAEFSQAELKEDPNALQPYAEGILAYLGGQNSALSLATDPSGTAFQQRVWAALKNIPYGETRTYSELAQAIGDPKAVRAVASACAANPVALVIPCHRIIRKSGELSGYRWGVGLKQALLEKEQIEHTLFSTA